MTGPAVTSLKLLAQATGEYTREELNKVAKLGWTDAAAKQIAEANKVAKLGWTDAAAKQIAAAKAAELGDGTSEGSGSGSGSQSGGRLADWRQHPGRWQH